MGRRRQAAALAVAAIAAGALAFAAAAPSEKAPAPRAFDSKCGVFPRPGPEVLAGAASLPDQRAWNQDVSQAPVDPSSDRIIAYINSHGDNTLHPDFGSNPRYGIPFSVVGKRAKPVKVKFTAYGDESDHGKYRIPLEARIEGGKNADGDRHAIAYDKARCKLYELYRAFPTKTKWKADSGAIWDVRSPALRRDGWTSADAAGLPVFPGLVRYEEVAAGNVDHALRVTVESSRDAWIHPASHCAGDTSAAGAPPMGLRLRLKAAYDTAAITGQAAPIAAALKQYGLFVADNGSNWFFQGGSDRRWDDDSLNQLKEIPGSAFEVVQSEAPVQSC